MAEHLMLIYLATNRYTAARYIGATTCTLAKRQIEHKRTARCDGKKRHSRFHQAIRQQGWDAFTWVVLQRCSSVEEMLSAERRWIAVLRTTNPACGYNMTKGGSGVVGYVFSEATRAKIARAGTGRVKSAETRLRLSIANKGKKPSEAAMSAVRGRKLSDEAKRRIGDANRGRKHVWSEDQYRKNYEATQRRKCSDRHSKIPHSHLTAIRARRAGGESFASIGRAYGVHASTLFVWLDRRASL